MAWERAQVGILARLRERDLQRGGLAGVDVGGLPAVDAQVVRDSAGVLELEGDGALANGLGRERKTELGRSDLHRGCRGTLRSRLLLAGMLLGAHRLGGLRRPELPVEPKEPEFVAVRATGECVAGGVERDDLFAVEREHARGVVRARPGLEAPETVAARGVVGLEVPVVAADEREIAARGRGTAVAGVIELLLPGDLVGRPVDRREGAGRRPLRRDRAAIELLAGLVDGRLSAFEELRLLDAAHVEEAGLLVEAHREPVGAAERARGRNGRSSRTVRSEDPAIVRELRALGQGLREGAECLGLNRVGDGRVNARVGLRRGGVLGRRLRYRTFVDPDQGLSTLAIE